MFDAMKPQYPVGEYTLSRRQALVAIAALPTVLLSVVYQRQQSTIVVGEFLSRCAASIVACWHLMKGNEFAVVEQEILKYLPILVNLAQQSSKHQTAAARLALQGYQLTGILAGHRLDLFAREQYCRQAVQYSRSTEDSHELVVALRHLASTFYYSERPEAMLKTLQEALPHINK